MAWIKIRPNSLVSAILISLIVFLLIECKEISVEEQDPVSDNLIDNLNLPGLPNRIVKQLGIDLVASGLSEYQATVIQLGALQEVNTQKLSSSDDIVLVAPAVMKGAQQAVGDNQAGLVTVDEKVNSIQLILTCVIQSVPSQISQNALLKVGAKLSSVNPSNALYTIKLDSYEQVFGSLSETLIQNLDEAGIGCVDGITCARILINSLIVSLVHTGVENSMLPDIIK